MSAKKGRILSGMRPTGPLHIGHLVGALNNWASLQDDYECFFMIADWHALMSEYENPETVRMATREVALDFVAAGLDPERSTIFVQSDVPEHLELYMAFSCVTPLGWLERCPTYKEQMRNITERDISNFNIPRIPGVAANACLQLEFSTANRFPSADKTLSFLGKGYRVMHLAPEEGRVYRVMQEPPAEAVVWPNTEWRQEAMA